jgi:hypothetical protein
MILKIKIFTLASLNFFKWSFAYMGEAECFNDVISEVVEAFQDAVCFYKLNTDPEFIEIERELAELDLKIESTENKIDDLHKS